MYQLNLTLGQELLNSDTMILSYNGTGIISTKDEALSPFKDERILNKLPGDPVTVTFQVKCNHTGASLAGCLVSFNGEEEISDENGRASFLTRPGDFQVGVEKKHLEPVSGKVLQVYSDTLFTLRLDSLAYEVMVLITDAESGDSLTGVSVSSKDQEEGTGSDGLAVLSLFAGPATFELDCFNYRPELEPVEIESDTLLKLQMLRSHAQVKFRLRYGEQPLNKASVELNGETIISNQLGQSVFPSIPVDVSLDYLVTRDGYHRIEGSVELTGDTTLLLQMEQVSSGAAWSGSLGEGLRVYPNPALDRIFLESGDESIIEIELLDLNGTRMLREEAGSGSHTLELPPGIPPGIYILKAGTARSTYCKRIVISL